MNFRGGGAPSRYAGRHFCRYFKFLKVPVEVSAPVRVLFKFTLLGRYRSFVGDLFSINSSLARYRFENKSPKNFFAKKQSKNEMNSSPLTVHSSLNNETAFSRFTSHFSPFKKSAFTMVEVLITLGIIGIVAAMTLPMLMAGYQRAVLKPQIKKFYSELSNAYNTVNYENGVPFQCYQVKPEQNSLIKEMIKKDECSLFWNNVFDKLKILQTCKGADCFPEYKTDSQVITEGGGKGNFGCPNLYSLIFNPGTKMYTLADGSVLYNRSAIEFAFDVNGVKGPNKWGYDLFYARNLFYNEQILVTDAVCGGMWEKGGMRLKDYLLDRKTLEKNAGYWW